MKILSHPNTAERDGDTYVPTSDDTLEHGDSITVLYKKEDFKHAFRLLHPRD
jgi:Trk K+ transport system NAD-binding subunit